MIQPQNDDKNKNTFDFLIEKTQDELNHITTDELKKEYDITLQKIKDLISLLTPFFEKYDNFIIEIVICSFLTTLIENKINNTNEILTKSILAKNRVDMDKISSLHKLLSLLNDRVDHLWINQTAYNIILNKVDKKYQNHTESKSNEIN